MIDDAHFVVQLGAALRQARLNAGYTQENLAKALQVTPGTIARYELGIRRISVITLLQMAQVMRQPLSHIVPGATRLEADSTSAPEMAPHEAVQAIIQALEQRPDLAPKILHIIQASISTEQTEHGSEQSLS